MSNYGYDYTGKNSDAIAMLYSGVQDQRSQIAKYSIMKAATYMQNGKSDEALAEFKKALGFDPQNTDVYTNMGNIYMSQGKPAEAIKAYKEVAKLQPDSATAHINLGNAYLQGKQYVESEKQFKAAARLAPREPLADYTLGLQYSNTNRFAEAEAQLKKVAKISPRDGNVYYSLGVLYNKQGRTEEAISNLEKALKLKTNFPAANYELGVAYEKAGNREGAEGQLAILNSKDYTLATDLQSVLNKPKIVAMSAKDGFLSILGAGTSLNIMDMSLKEANSSRTFSMDIQFSNEMDVASISNPLNWSITRANDSKGGYYNDTMPSTSREAVIPPIPLSVIYNPESFLATITFRVSQNANSDATIDPKHLVFSFKGTDAAGREMDKAADQIDGYSVLAY